MLLPTSTRIGIVSGLIMIVTSILIFYFKGGFDNAYQYITYGIYAGSIVFAQHIYSGAAREGHKLKNYFSEGFKTFIVITLLMVIFTRVFISYTPELTRDAAETLRRELLSNANKTEAEINNELALYRKNYNNIMTSIVIFGYLAIGSLVSLTGGLFYSRRNIGKPANN
jgi:hypothetical protein